MHVLLRGALAQCEQTLFKFQVLTCDECLVQCHPVAKEVIQVHRSPVIGFLSLQAVDMVLKGAFVTPRGDMDQRILFMLFLSIRLFTCLFLPSTRATHDMLARINEQRKHRLSQLLDGKLIEAVC